ncbi:hypothetical protein COO60DRAFT_1461507 [Scenedesmus sp. NREL 46B-D3]|nr:hypothetical protein COO60DRAFT_1461507 [Scenedesmus sp. NREL 46B-D3]
MQCFVSCFGDAQRNHQQLGMHLHSPAKLTSTAYLQQEQQPNRSPVSNCSEESHFTSSSGSGSSDVSGYAADAFSWRDRDQALFTQPAKVIKDVHSTPAATGTAGAATTHDDLYPYILQHGRGILSLSTLQQGLQHFLVPGVGYIAYAMMYNGPDWLNIRTPVSLGDPICDPPTLARWLARSCSRTQRRCSCRWKD